MLYLTETEKCTFRKTIFLDFEFFANVCTCMFADM